MWPWPRSDILSVRAWKSLTKWPMRSGGTLREGGEKPEEIKTQVDSRKGHQQMPKFEQRDVIYQCPINPNEIALLVHSSPLNT